MQISLNFYTKIVEFFYKDNQLLRSITTTTRTAIPYNSFFMIEITRTAHSIIPAIHFRKTGISVPPYVLYLKAGCRRVSVTTRREKNAVWELI